METPRAKAVAHGGYSAEEKQSILENLDIEVADKKRRFDDYLERMLKSFLLRQESEVTRIPRKIRSMTMREFGTKYNGDIKFCMEAMAREKLEEGGNIELDASARKRKRQEFAQDGAPDLEPSRPAKSPRKIPPSSAKKQNQTPSGARWTPGRAGASKSLRSPRGILRTNTLPGPDPFRGPATTSTPLKPSTQPLPLSTIRPPTLSSFNPLLPATPAYPRKLRRDESLLSANGSPVTNPFDYLGEDVSDISLEAPLTRHQRLHTASGVKAPGGRGERGTSIMVRRDSLSASAASTAAPSALLSVPTKYGQVIEFDPLITSPRELDELEGISDSAKKKAKEDMVKLVQQTLSKWTL